MAPQIGLPDRRGVAARAVHPHLPNRYLRSAITPHFTSPPPDPRPDTMGLEFLDGIGRNEGKGISHSHTSILRCTVFDAILPQLVINAKYSSASVSGRGWISPVGAVFLSMPVSISPSSLGNLHVERERRVHSLGISMGA